MNTQEQRAEVLKKHLHTEHHQTPFESYFKEVIYGGIDGIITTFAVVAGFSGAAFSNETTTQLSFLVVLLFGLANLFADGVSMGLGNFLSVKSDQDLYASARNKETREVRENSDLEFEETITILTQKGYSEEDAATMANLYRKNEAYWVDFMMNHELEMSDPRGDNPVLTGLATFGAFLLFGSIPLLPFIFAGEASASSVFLYSVTGTVIALVLLGLLKWRIVGSSLGKSLFEVLVVGGAAALVAFSVGSLFDV
jgi:VIT1/CCC1 family predicted Fe2+/Mn2+ transporter